MIRRWLPTREQILKRRGLRRIHPWLHHPFLWHFSRRRVAGALGLGLVASMIPGPFQMIAAAILAIRYRLHLPTALATTLFTNPLTIVPLYWLAYRIGALVLGSPPYSLAAMQRMAGSDWRHLWPSLGPPWLIGMPILTFFLALAFYWLVRLLWSLRIRYRWWLRRHRQRAARQEGS